MYLIKFHLINIAANNVMMIWNCSDYSVVYNKVLEVPFSLSMILIEIFCYDNYIKNSYLERD